LPKDPALVIESDPAPEPTDTVYGPAGAAKAGATESRISDARIENQQNAFLMLKLP
jgi:hypothetical protein